MRSPLSGQVPREAVIGHQTVNGDAKWIAVDPTSGDFFWSSVRPDAVYRDRMQIVLGSGTINGITVDPVDGKVYWASRAEDKIERANFDGSSKEDVVVGTRSPVGLFLEPRVGDFDGDGILSARDVDGLTLAVRNRSFAPGYDVNQNGQLDQSDRRMWVVDLKNTYFGDSNLDGLFDFSDFVSVFQIGEYEDRVENNSGWADGDWNGDGEFGSGDLVLAFREGGYVKGPRAAAIPVPEPGPVSLCWIVIGMLGCNGWRRRRCST